LAATAAALVTTPGVLVAAVPAQGADGGGWQWPVRGRVITPYSNDNARPYAGGMHRGIDIAAPVGTPVVAARAGNVGYAGNLGKSGLTISVRSADGRHVASYLHLGSIAVERGEAVRAGERLGEVGTTGERSVAEPHLHFGVRLADREGFYIDPLSLLPPMPPLPAPAGGAGPAPLRAPAPVPVAPVRAPVAAAPRRIPATRTRTVPAGSIRPLPRSSLALRGPLSAARPGIARNRAATPSARRLRPGDAAPQAAGSRVPAGPGAQASGAQWRDGRRRPVAAGDRARAATAGPSPGPRGSHAPGLGALLALAGLALMAAGLAGRAARAGAFDVTRAATVGAIARVRAIRAALPRGPAFTVRRFEKGH
jgi:hypothetical protein